MGAETAVWKNAERSLDYAGSAVAISIIDE